MSVKQVESQEPCQKQLKRFDSGVRSATTSGRSHPDDTTDASLFTPQITKHRSKTIKETSQTELPALNSGSKRIQQYAVFLCWKNKQLLKQIDQHAGTRSR
jgi:hypothetical protein